MLIEKIKKINFKIGYIIICIIFLIALVYINSTHAYYSDSVELPLFNAKVGDFSGKGDTSPLDKNTDVNLIFYVQNLLQNNGYYIAPSTPVVMTGYILNEKKSNCIPTDATYEKYDNKDYTIAENGTVTVNVTQNKPSQVVCRIYYDMSSSGNDLMVFALLENEIGTIEYDSKKYAFESDLPQSGYIGYECKNSETITTINYDSSKGFTYETSGPNVCYAYFSK